MSLLLSRSPARSAVLFFAVLTGLSAMPGRSAAQSGATRSAVVLDATTRRPVAAAAVSAGRAFTLTGPDGSFQLTVPRGADQATVERMGYATVQIAVSAWPSEILLQPEPYLLEHLAVEVRRGEALASGTALAVASVDRSTLDATAATSVAELLSGLEGVEDSRVGSWGSRPVVRGLTGERLAILIDGNRVNRACTFGMDQGLASIDPNQVERVEVLSGPGSALFGSGNVGGVINVVTRGADGVPGTSGEIRGGASSAVPGGSLGGSLRSGTERVRLAVNVDASSYGDYRTPTATVDGSSYRQITGDGKVEFRPSAAQKLSVKGQYYAGRDIGWPMMRGAEIPSETRTSYSADYGWQLGGSLLDALTVRAFRQKLDHHMTVDAVMTNPSGMTMTAKADAVSYSTTSGGRAQLRLTPTAAVHADVGAEVNRWFAEGTRWSQNTMGTMPATDVTFRTWPAVTITDVGAFLQGEARAGSRVAVSVGGRLDRVRRDAEDRPASSETVATGNAGFRLDLGAGLGLRTSLGVGFRTPDPMELYGQALKPDGFVYQGDPTLKTERSLGTEAALTWSAADVIAGLTVFRNRIEDMVSPVLAPGLTVAGRPVRLYTAVGSATLTGFSTNLDLSLPAGFGARATASYTRGRDEATGAPLAQIPPLSGEAALRKTTEALPWLRWVEVGAQAADAQTRVSTAAGEKATAGYAVFAVRLGAEAGGVFLSAGVENVLDRAWRAHLDPATLLRPGRNLFVRVTRSF